MKILIVLVALLIPLSARAEPCRGWSTADSWRQAAVVTLQAIDWAQTRKFNADPRFKGTETNPILGRDPSPDRINLLIGGAVIGHALVSCLLPPSGRVHWQVFFMGAEADAIRHNLGLGIGLGF